MLWLHGASFADGCALQKAAERGLILVDTKFEFGKDESGAIVLADEILTPDSSRSRPLTEALTEVLTEALTEALAAAAGCCCWLILIKNDRTNLEVLLHRSGFILLV